MKYLLILFTCWFPLKTMAQKLPDFGLHHIRISDTDKNIQAEILPVTNMPAVKPELNYYWYGAGGIHQLQGGFSGQLLNGAYTEYYKNKNVKTQGTFKKGLKDGVWKEWNEYGKLNYLITWEEGIQTGPFSFYNTEGRVIRSGTYKRNQLNGRLSLNEGTDSAQTIRYKNGKIVPSKSGSFLKRIHLFKKKTAPKPQPTP